MRASSQPSTSWTPLHQEFRPAIYAENLVDGVKVFFFFFQLLYEHSNELSGDGSTAALYIFNFGSRAPNAFVVAFYF